MSARTNARATGRERPESASSTRMPRILLPIDWPALEERRHQTPPEAPQGLGWWPGRREGGRWGGAARQRSGRGRGPRIATWLAVGRWRRGWLGGAAQGLSGSLAGSVMVAAPRRAGLVLGHGDSSRGRRTGRGDAAARRRESTTPARPHPPWTACTFDQARARALLDGERPCLIRCAAAVTVPSAWEPLRRMPAGGRSTAARRARSQARRGGSPPARRSPAAALSGRRRRPSHAAAGERW
jgi:hypothetical protein